MKKVNKLNIMLERRLYTAQVIRQYELDVANETFKREKVVAIEQFEVKGVELKECLLNDLHDKRKAYDQCRLSIDLIANGGVCMCVCVGGCVHVCGVCGWGVCWVCMRSVCLLSLIVIISSVLCHL